MHGYLWHACALGSHCNSSLTRSALLRLTCTAPHGVTQQSLSGAAGVLGGFYTQADIKELIGYASDRGVMPQTRRSAEQQPGCKPSRTDTRTQTRTHPHAHARRLCHARALAAYGRCFRWCQRESQPLPCGHAPPKASPVAAVTSAPGLGYPRAGPPLTVSRPSVGPAHAVSEWPCAWPQAPRKGCCCCYLAVTSKIGNHRPLVTRHHHRCIDSQAETH